MSLTRKTKEETADESNFYGDSGFFGGHFRGFARAGHDVVLAVTQPDKPKDAEKRCSLRLSKECCVKAWNSSLSAEKSQRAGSIEELRK